MQEAEPQRETEREGRADLGRVHILATLSPIIYNYKFPKSCIGHIIHLALCFMLQEVIHGISLLSSYIDFLCLNLKVEAIIGKNDEAIMNFEKVKILLLVCNNSTILRLETFISHF